MNYDALFVCVTSDRIPISDYKHKLGGNLILYNFDYGILEFTSCAH